MRQISKISFQMEWMWMLDLLMGGVWFMWLPSLVNIHTIKACFVWSSVNDSTKIKTKIIFDILHHLGRVQICRFLIDKGADVDIHNENVSTPLYLAAKNGHKSVVDLLLIHNASMNCQEPKNGNTSVLIAANGGDLKWNSRKEPKILQIHFDKTIIREFSAYAGHLEIVYSLIQNHSDVNIVNNDGHSPLYFALKKGNRKVAVLLIKNGADVSFELGPWKRAIFDCVVSIGNWVTNEVSVFIFIY